jgi:uncharacterized protein involved in exopolysaccharide biosynthesis
MSETSVFEDLSIFSDRNSIENEKAILSSRNMMRNVVEKLDLCHEYYQIGNLTGFKKSEIYKLNPFKVEFDIDSSIDINDYSLVFLINVISKSEFSFEIENSGKKKMHRFDNWFQVMKGINIKIVKNENFTNYTIGRNFEYKYLPVQKAINKYLGKITIEQKETNSTVLILKIIENSIEKGQDVLNELINQYNLDAIDDKNLISKNTSDFISNRVSIISEELGLIEDSAKVYKNKNDVTNVGIEIESGLLSASDIRKKIIESNTFSCVGCFSILVVKVELQIIFSNKD